MKTLTVDGVKWEYSESEGLWFSGKYRLGRCDRRGLKSQWELFLGNVSLAVAASCGDLMSMVAHKQV